MSTLTARPIVSSRYVPQWGAWEAYRELFCNCVDADRDGYFANIRSEDRAEFFTRTAPSFHNLCVVGDGTKDLGGDTIGQFGEGLKLAALTAVRLGGSLSVHVPGASYSYELREEEGAAAAILYIVPLPESDRSPKQGCLIDLHIPGANFREFAGNFVPVGQTLIARPKHQPNNECLIYCKGVYINTLQSTSLYNYNFPNLSINRDRSNVDVATIHSQLRHLICTSPEIADFADRMLTEPATADLEVSAMSGWGWSSTTKTFRDAFKAATLARYGKKVCLPSDTAYHNEAAMLKGYVVLNVDQRLHAYLVEAGIRRAEDVLPPIEKQKRSEKDPSPQAALDRALVNRIYNLVDVSPPTVVFCESDSASHADNILYIPADRIGDRLAIIESAVIFLPIFASTYGNNSLKNLGTLAHSAAALIDKLLPPE